MKETGKTGRLVGIAVLMAVIIVLQTAFGAIQLGPFTITLTLVPIIIGAVLFGPAAGALLGTTFGVVVAAQVVTGAAGAGSTMMLEANAAATLTLCVAKGLLAGLAAGIAARTVGKKNLWAGILLAAILSPVCNTGLFTIGLVTIFRSLAEQWALSSGAQSVGSYILAGIIGVNFVIELAVDLILAPVIFRIIRAVRQS